MAAPSNPIGITRRVEILAAAAFVLAVSTATYEVATIRRGAQPVLYGPDEVYVYFEYDADRVAATRLVAQLSLTNAGATGANVVLRDLSAQVSVGSLTFTDPWFSFVSVARTDKALQVQPTAIVHPFVLAAGGAESQLIAFAPVARPCDGATACDPHADYIDKVRFLDAVAATRAVSVVFTARLLGVTRPLRTECRIRLAERSLVTLAENNWYAARCAPLT